MKVQIKKKRKQEVNDFQINPIYQIDDTLNLDRHGALQNASTFPDFQNQLEKFKIELLNNIEKAKSVSYYKFGDGDYYFLKGKPVGSAKPGNRALSRQLTKSELNLYRKGACENDKYLCEIYPENRKKFKKVLRNTRIDYPSEFIYGLIASRWVTSLPYKIGLIGSANKLAIIKKLTDSAEYKNYIGREEFQSYISIPQRFACDNLDLRLKEIAEQITIGNSDLYLVGIGHLKSGVLHELKKMQNAVFLDIGSGIDALAGVVDSERPYFGNWKNFRLQDEKFYDDLDLLNFNGQNIIQLD